MSAGTAGRPRLQCVLRDVTAEIRRAEMLHSPYQSIHEGYAVMLEEFDELWDAIKKQSPEEWAIRVEAMHVACTAIRFLHDLCYTNIDKESCAE